MWADLALTVLESRIPRLIHMWKSFWLKNNEYVSDIIVKLSDMSDTLPHADDFIILSTTLNLCFINMFDSISSGLENDLLDLMINNSWVILENDSF